MFSYLASELRSGDIAVVGADSYASLHAQLMSWDECVPLAEQFCGQAGIPSDPTALTAHYRAVLGDIAAVVDAGFPHNTELSFEDGRPVLRRRKGADRRPSALALEEAIHQRLNEFAKLDVAGMWGDGRVVSVDGTQVDTWENNILAESHIRYGGYGGIAYRHLSDTYIALFSHFIPCGVWEVVYIIEGLLRNDSDIQPDTIHVDTQGQSLPVFGLAALLGFDLLPRIRNWADLNFYRPNADTGFEHIDSLFGDNVIDWGLIETHWTDLLRIAISIGEGRLSSVTLLRRLGNNSRKNRLYWVLDLSPPDAVPVTTLDLVTGALFPGDITADAAPAAPAPRRTRQRVTSKKGS
ncbi:hypothetical protein J2853_002353 [Streptosporangium lutulentum]|uniref:Tn3 transposase DDE domain-containing protein n=1 Tax=Streptosporangium lutulentum TaxID=1461250 RepID=A0ABT9Q905_9ACTN|nr:Tn3 family transposase [Streptosporangium lutulentum]MDP9843142.1 hypothetical protein [Streptosporangium lutulentum]